MTPNDELIGLLEDYLDRYEGPTPMPDALRDAIRAELPFTRQLRPVPGPRRMLSMFNAIPRPALIGLVVALAVGVSLLGYSLVRGPAHVGAPTPTARPSASRTSLPSPTPTIAAEADLLTAGTVASRYGADNPPNLPRGHYFLDSPFPARISMDVPTGWFVWDPAIDYDGILVDSPGARSGSGWGIVFTIAGPLSLDPCNQYKGQLDGAVSSSVDAVVAAISAWPGFEVQSSEAIELDGHAGRQVTLTTSLDHASCPSPILWVTPIGSYWEDAYGAIGDQRHEITYRFVQIGNHVLVIRTTEFADTSPFELTQGIPATFTRHAGDLAVLEAIVSSIQIEDR